MIETLGDLPAGVLGFKGSGRISRAEYQEMMEPIYEALERGGRLARSGRAPYLRWARGTAGDRLAG